jgi:hypothetical protein
MSYRKLFLTGACALACLGGAAAVATGEGDPSPVPVPEVKEADAAPVATVEPEQAEQIEELDRPRTADDALPTQWRDEISEGENADEHWGANASLSRRTAPGVWIVPGDGYVCVANSTPGEGALGFGCASTDDLERGLLAPSDVDANGNGVLTGVVPDGVTEVRLINQDGSERSVPVDRNTYRAAIDANLKEARFTSAEGVERVLPMAWSK